MVSWVFYGMVNEGLVLNWFVKVDLVCKILVWVILVVVVVVLLFVLFFLFVWLVEVISFVILGVFVLVNLVFFVIGIWFEDGLICCFCWWGIVGVFMCVFVVVF